MFNYTWRAGCEFLTHHSKKISTLGDSLHDTHEVTGVRTEDRGAEREREMSDIHCPLCVHRVRIESWV